MPLGRDMCGNFVAFLFELQIIYEAPLSQHLLCSSVLIIISKMSGERGRRPFRTSLDISAINGWL